MSELLQEILSRGGPAFSFSEAPAPLPTLDELVDRYVLFLLDRTLRNVSQTARILGISRTALYGRLRRMGLS
jgi:transcriptional regulator of acetoin/glycerol metabolism